MDVHLNQQIINHSLKSLNQYKKAMKTYNIVFNGKKLNSKPLSFEKAFDEQMLCIMNYGYKPEIVET